MNIKQSTVHKHTGECCVANIIVCKKRIARGHPRLRLSWFKWRRLWRCGYRRWRSGLARGAGITWPVWRDGRSGTWSVALAALCPKHPSRVRRCIDTNAPRRMSRQKVQCLHYLPNVETHWRCGFILSINTVYCANTLCVAKVQSPVSVSAGPRTVHCGIVWTLSRIDFTSLSASRRICLGITISSMLGVKCKWRWHVLQDGRRLMCLYILISLYLYESNASP